MKLPDLGKRHIWWLYLWAGLFALLPYAHFFFWDTVQLSSLQAHWYFDQKFAFFFLPEQLDSGHPPFWGIYLALIWSVFGRSLLISHLAMLPFLLGIVWQVSRFKEGNLPSGTKYWFLLWLFVDPVFAGQAIMVSPDIALLFFFIAGVRGVLEDRKWALLIAGLGLAAVSLRGMMVAAALGLFIVSRAWTTSDSKKLVKAIKGISPLIPGGLLALFFLAGHFLVKGWLGFHPDSPWAPSFESVDVIGVLYNVAVLGWRFLDHGRVGEVIVLLIVFWILRKNLFQLLKGNDWLILFLCLAVFLLPSMLLKKGLLAHRYLLPLFISLHLFTLSFSFNLKLSFRKVLKPVVWSFLILGNLWIYPRKVSQGWEATLAHWPYYELRNHMIEYIDEKGISLNQIGTVFPNTAQLRYIDLSERTAQFALKDLNTNEYFFYSNVFNDLSDEEIDTLFLKWKKEKELKRGGVEVILFSAPED
jgi:hypothetical protein